MIMSWLWQSYYEIHGNIVTFILGFIAVEVFQQVVDIRLLLANTPNIWKRTLPHPSSFRSIRISTSDICTFWYSQMDEKFWSMNLWHDFLSQVFNIWRTQHILHPEYTVVINLMFWTFPLSWCICNDLSLLHEYTSESLLRCISVDGKISILSW